MNKTYTLISLIFSSDGSKRFVKQPWTYAVLYFFSKGGGITAKMTVGS